MLQVIFVRNLVINLFQVSEVVTINLNYLVNDGAVFYLNGSEIHRINMPAGAISHSTPAQSDITNAVYSGNLVVPSSALVPGGECSCFRTP